MSPNPRSHPSPRARAVAEAPVGPLLGRVEELARQWAIALILERSLERVAELHLEMVARKAPALCAQIIRSLESDTELERLLGGDAAAGGRTEAAWAHKPITLAGAGGAGSPAEMVEAVEALRGVLWEALLDELRSTASERSAARQVADLSDRLAYVCATILAAAVAGPDAADPGEPWLQAHSPAGSGVVVGGSRPSPIGPHGAILIDERDQAETPPARREAPVRQEPPARPQAPPRPQEPVQPAHREPRQAEVQQRQPRPLPWDTPARPARSVPPDPAEPRSRPIDAPAPWAERPAGPGELPAADPVPPADVPSPTATAGADADAVEGPEIEVRDERGEEGPAAWIGSIGRQLERFERDQLPFAVLLVDLGDAERLRRAALPAAMSNLTGRIERTLAQELQRIGGHPAQRRGRPAGELTCERPGRYWLLVPGTEAVAAGRLAEWIAHTLGGLAGRRWAPLEVKVGIAVCPDDGREAAALAAHADLALYAQRPAGR